MLIDIDDQVYAELERRAIPYVDHKPNDTIRRILGLSAGSQAKTDVSGSKPPSSSERREKKVRLNDLVDRGLLKIGQTLMCVDYTGSPIRDSEAQVVAGNKLMPLKLDGRPHSMSELAVIMLRKAGHRVEAARGPAHWRTAEGRRVLDLWHQR